MASAATGPATPTLNADLARDTLALVGTRAITAADLVKRIEWMPWAEKGRGASMDSAKVRALQSLAGEALLAEQARREGLGDAGRVGRMRAALRRALVRDALYHEITAGAPPPSPADVDRALRARPVPATAAERHALRRTVTDSLTAISAHERASEFMGSILGPQRAVVDSATFMRLADSLCSVMAATRDARARPNGYALVADDVDVMLSRLARALGRTLVRLPGGTLTLGDALEDLRFYTFTFRSLDRERFAAELSVQLKVVVAGELMAREGLRRHLDTRPEVQGDLEMWTATWGAHMILMREAGGPPASDDAAFRQLALTEPERARRICEVDVAEVLTGSKPEASRVLALLQGGADFDSLARRSSIRAEWAARAGRSRFFRVERHAQLGYAALLAPLDTLLGPLHLPEGYSVFRVLGKRLTPDSAGARTLVEGAREQATGEQRAERAARYTATLAGKSRVQFNYPALAGVEIMPSNMLTKRTLGFGGGMLAAPSLPPLWQWVPIWQRAQAPLP